MAEARVKYDAAQSKAPRYRQPSCTRRNPWANCRLASCRRPKNERRGKGGRSEAGSDETNASDDASSMCVVDRAREVGARREAPGWRQARIALLLRGAPGKA